MSRSSGSTNPPVGYPWLMLSLEAILNWQNTRLLTALQSSQHLNGSSKILFDIVIGSLRAQRIQKGRMKFRVEITGIFEEAVSLDKKNSNTLWQDSIEKDMKNSRLALKILERLGKSPVGYTKIACHLVFDLKTDMTKKIDT